MITGQPMFNPSLASETRQQVWNASFVYLKISYLLAVLGIKVFHPVSRILIFLIFFHSGLNNNTKEEGGKFIKFELFYFRGSEIFFS
jgi:hypothetical protein